MMNLSRAVGPRTWRQSTVTLSVVEVLMFSPRSRQRTLPLVTILSLTAFGCVSPSASVASRRPTPQWNEISSAEIAAALPRYKTAYDMVVALRPGMLVSRSMSSRQSGMPLWESDPGIKVYLDGIRYGGVESLHAIPASTVREVRWLSALDATTRYGTGHTAGAITVTSRTGRR
jgi:hypothetical protein